MIDVKNMTFGLSRDPNLEQTRKVTADTSAFELSALGARNLSLWQAPFWLQTAKNSSGSGYYVGGSSTLPRGGSLLRAYSPATSSIAGGPSATPTQSKTLTTPGIRMPAFPLFLFTLFLIFTRVPSCTHVVRTPKSRSRGPYRHDSTNERPNNARIITFALNLQHCIVCQYVKFIVHK